VPTPVAATEAASPAAASASLPDAALPCPVGRPSVPLPQGSPSAQAWLSYFNGGGSTGGLAPLGASRHAEGIDFPSLLAVDLTGDGLLDLVVATPMHRAATVPTIRRTAGRLDVLLCRDQQYVLAWSLSSDAETAVPLPRLVTDVNFDGRQDVVLSQYACGAHTCFEDLAVLAWDGAHLADRWEGSSFDLPFPDVQLIPTEDVPPSIQVTGTGYGSAGAGPYRPVRRSWRWDSASGTMRIESEERLPTNYRIHVLQDALRAESEGRREEASDLYRQVATDASLQDWLDPPREQANLGAYAILRRMRLHALLGDSGDVRVGYDELQSRYPAGADGHVFAVMGQAFGESYERQADLKIACQAAGQAAAASDEDVLGLLDFGYANPTPALEDLCPAADG
jgi:hypothetical protein